MLIQEKILLKISLMVSIIGLFILYIISSKISLDFIKIGEIDDELIDKEVKVKGLIKSYQNSPSVMKLKVEDSSGSIYVTAFKDENIKFKTKMNIEVIGTVQKYKSELEIIAKTIQVL